MNFLRIKISKGMIYNYPLSLLGEYFIPTIDVSAKLPDAAGAYLICAKNNDILLARMKELQY
jgi:hypothetical protein